VRTPKAAWLGVRYRNRLMAAMLLVSLPFMLALASLLTGLATTSL